MFDASVADIVATQVLVVLVMSQNTVSPEESIVCTIVFKVPKLCVTVPDRLPAVIVPTLEVIVLTTGAN
jgi:hypothetical protein